jgi:radical SAM protein with 4Fe4S-binding SPASM domain
MCYFATHSTQGCQSGHPGQIAAARRIQISAQFDADISVVRCYLSSSIISMRFFRAGHSSRPRSRNSQTRVTRDYTELVSVQPRGGRPTVTAVWEITLGCNLRCIHCGSRAGNPRDRELATDDALAVVEQLANSGVTEVVLIGGEAYLRRDWEIIAAAIVRSGMFCGLTTGGWGLTTRLAERMAVAGITTVSVSIDGSESTHDRLRGRVGSWRRGIDALANLRSAGYSPNVNTQLNRWSIPELPRIYLDVRDAGAAGWQVQFTGPMGRAADHPELLIQPFELPVAHDVLARVAARAWADGIVVAPAFNVGYFGPHERLIRGGGAPYAFWQGPDQGLRTLGIESDGTVKPEATLPTRAYAAGNLLEEPLIDLLDKPIMSYLAAIKPDQLSGFCSTCEFHQVCLGGDPWMTHLLTGSIGNNPFCDHRARTLATQGVRERVVVVAAAPGRPYDFAHCVTVVEDSDDLSPSSHPLAAVDIEWPSDWIDAQSDPRQQRSRGRDVQIFDRSEFPLPRMRPGNPRHRVGQLIEIKRKLDQREAER